MLKKRIIAVLVVRDGILVQSIGFRRYLPVGKPDIAVEFLNQWGIDEIILLDISATPNARAPELAMVKSVAKSCLVPLTVGGGISTLEQIHNLMHCGADKVSFNFAALNQSKLLTEAARIFGSQCVVASIDAIAKNSTHQVYNYISGKTLGIKPWEHAKQIEEAGVGEIFINSVDRDGMKCGYDLELISKVKEAVSIPVIACGGAGKPSHLLEVLEHTGVEAVAAGNFFHFFEHSVTITKALTSLKQQVRHETFSKYLDNTLDDSGRLLKKDDDILENLLYNVIEKETI
jgi:cyclase